MSTPRPGAVRCLSRIGFHTMRYAEWGAADNPRVLLCLHGLTRVGKDFARLAENLSDEAHSKLLEIAAQWEQLAQQCERRFSIDDEREMLLEAR